MQTVFPHIRNRRPLRRFLSHEVATALDPGRLPRRIFLFWDKGLRAAPGIVRYCVESWQMMNPSWDVVVLDADEAACILPRTRLRPDISVNHYSDLLRSELLKTYGGVWADATSLCTRPLDHWIDMPFLQASFFAFDRPGADRRISTWFLASVPNDPLITRWNEAQIRFWAPSRQRSPPYFASHYLFDYLVRFDRVGRKEWARVPKIGAEPPHRMQRILSGGTVWTPKDLAIIAAAPVHKLTYKTDIGVRQVERLLHAARSGGRVLDAA